MVFPLPGSSKHHGPGDHDQCDPRGVTQTGREGIRDLANGRRFGRAGWKKKAAVQHHGYGRQAIEEHRDTREVIWNMITQASGA